MITGDCQTLKLVLMPGMDGSGELFADFVRFLPDWIAPQNVSYPHDRKLSFAQLQSKVKSELPASEPFALLAESFSTPIAVSIAAARPSNLKALIICAGFVSSPIRGIPRFLVSIFSSILFGITLPDFLLHRYLVGNTASSELVSSVRSAVSKVSASVMAYRLRAVLNCDRRLELRSVSVPLIYIAGSNDRLIPEHSVAQIKSAKPDACFRSIEGPHLIVQVQPEKVAEILECFLQQIT